MRNIEVTKKKIIETQIKETVELFKFEELSETIKNQVLINEFNNFRDGFDCSYYEECKNCKNEE